MMRIFSSYRTEIAIAVAIVVLELALGILVPNALTFGNISDIAQASAPLIIMAVGVLLVVITGGIDLSVGSIFSLTGMVTGLAMNSGYNSVLSTILGLLVGVVFGGINGFLVTFVGLAPFVVTLITYAVAASLAFIVTNGHSLPINDQNYYLLNGGTLIPGVPNFVLFCVVLVIVTEFVLRRVVAGRWALPLCGTPDQIVERIGELHRAGLDGIVLSWVDYAEGLEQMEELILPRMVAAGLRAA